MGVQRPAEKVMVARVLDAEVKAITVVLAHRRTSTMPLTFFLTGSTHGPRCLPSHMQVVEQDIVVCTAFTESECTKLLLQATRVHVSGKQLLGQARSSKILHAVRACLARPCCAQDPEVSFIGPKEETVS